MRSLEHKAHEILRTQVHIPQIFQSPWHSSKMIKTFECTNVQLHDHLILQAYTNISIQVCAHMCRYHSSEYQYL